MSNEKSFNIQEALPEHLASGTLMGWVGRGGGGGKGRRGGRGVKFTQHKFFNGHFRGSGRK